MNGKSISRRRFVTTAGIAAGVLVLKPSIVKRSQANSALRIGFLGCGGRGTSVATAFVSNLDNNCRIHWCLEHEWQMHRLRGELCLPRHLRPGRNIGELDLLYGTDHLGSHGTRLRGGLSARCLR